MKLGFEELYSEIEKIIQVNLKILKKRPELNQRET